MKKIYINKNPLVSIIIPLHWGLKKENFNRFIQDFENFLRMDYSNYEIIIISDIRVKLPFLSEKIKHITTPKKTKSPSEKRDYALKIVKGKICAFIDDDAYPDKEWVKKAVEAFSKYNIVAVGGPGETPPNDSFWQKIGGYIIESYFCSGGVQYRFYGGIKKKLFVDDYPAYNLFIKTDVLKKVGGFGSAYYGGEDTLLCIKLAESGDILYDSEIKVYHHRRSFPYNHLKQISNVGLHRGYFFKKFPETSRRVFYLLPTLLTCAFFLSILLVSIFYEIFFFPFVIVLIVFLLLGMLSVRSHGVGWGASLISGVGIILTHLVYGVFFVKGLIVKQLEN